MDTNIFFLLYLGYIYLIIARGKLGRAAMTKTGPNDASGVIWPIGMYFFSCNRVLWILTVFLLYLGYIYLIIALGRLGRAAMTKTGPNDARCIVWPIGMYFLFCNHVL